MSKPVIPLREDNEAYLALSILDLPVFKQNNIDLHSIVLVKLGGQLETDCFEDDSGHYWLSYDGCHYAFLDTSDKFICFNGYWYYVRNYDEVLEGNFQSAVNFFSEGKKGATSFRIKLELK